MNNSNSTGSASAPAPDTGFSPWKRLKTKKISYLTLPLLFMATVTEFVILATGWKYQQVVCLPKGMGVTFFGIGPIGATILAVELLKLPLAIWTASRHGWQKYLMICVGLPLICLLTFQLVKDMAVYEMGVALAPATQYLEQATAEDQKIAQLSDELSAIQGKKTERETKLAELSAKQAKAKADLEDALKRNDDARKDAVNLTDYQRNQLNEVDAREAAIIQQANSDSDQINKTLASLRTQRETEVARDSKWNAEEARIDNEYKTKLADYQNKKAQYTKDKAEYDNANILKKQLMHEPVDPGVPPVRESNTMLKSTLLTDIDNQIKAKEDELAAVNNKRRDRIAQVEADARQLRGQFEGRSGTKRDEADKNRTELLAAQAKLDTDFQAERKQIDADLAVAVQKVDGIQSELDAAHKRAETAYEAREAAIRTTQVHRIATTVEIIRGLIKGERPMSIKATAKERGDILTDQISMVRIWVYPVLAFIVAFLPTLMVEIGFSTVFQPEKQRPAYRLGFLGRRMHELYTRAGRFKMLHYERMAKDATAQITSRDRAVSNAKAAMEKAMKDKENGLLAAEEALTATVAEYDEKLKKLEEEYAAASQKNEDEWVSKLANMADTLNRTVIEKDTMRDFQKSEVERQIQMRQNAWSERVTQLREELDNQRVAFEKERTDLMQTQHKKLLEVTEDCKTQVIQARRQVADAEMGIVDATAKMQHDLKEALHARDAAETQLKQQTESLTLQLKHAREDAERELEKAIRADKHRMEREQLELSKIVQHQEESFDRRVKQREQELAIAFDARLAEERTRLDQEAHRRETELEQQFAARAIEIEARAKQEMVQKEETALFKLKQREQQLQTQSEGRLSELQSQAEQEFRRREQEFQNQLEGQTRDAAARLKTELQQKEIAFEARLKQREQELAVKAATRETELHNQWNEELRLRVEELERQAASRVRAAETRLAHEVQQKEELHTSKLRQREQQLQAKLDSLKAELQAQHDEALRRRNIEAEAALREQETNLRKEIQQREEAAQAKVKQREQELTNQLMAQAEARRLAAQAQWESDTEIRLRTAVDPLKAQLARLEKERDEAKRISLEGTRQVQHLEKKLTEASSFLSSWRNGNGKGVGTEG